MSYDPYSSGGYAPPPDNNQSYGQPPPPQFQPNPHSRRESNDYNNYNNNNNNREGDYGGYGGQRGRPGFSPPPPPPGGSSDQGWNSRNNHSGPPPRRRSASPNNRYGGDDHYGGGGGGGGGYRRDRGTRGGRGRNRDGGGKFHSSLSRHMVEHSSSLSKHWREKRAGEKTKLAGKRRTRIEFLAGQEEMRKSGQRDNGMANHDGSGGINSEATSRQPRRNQLARRERMNANLANFRNTEQRIFLVSIERYSSTSRLSATAAYSVGVTIFAMHAERLHPRWYRKFDRSTGRFSAKLSIFQFLRVRDARISSLHSISLSSSLHSPFIVSRFSRDTLSIVGRFRFLRDLSSHFFSLSPLPLPPPAFIFSRFLR